MTARLPRMEAVPQQCDACPFGDEPAGIKIREGMGPFYYAIVEAIEKRREPFRCHKTTEKTGGTPPERLCAGALKIQPKPRCVIVDPRGPA